MVSDATRSYNTKELLHQISYHLSTRECCKGREYTLILSDDCEYGYKFDMEVQVFPDIYHRRETDKKSVMQHILQNHMARICNNAGRIRADTIIPGTYVYKKSFDGRRRKWIQVHVGESL